MNLLARICAVLALLAAPRLLAGEMASYDAELAKHTGADARGMRSYVLVILKSSTMRTED